MIIDAHIHIPSADGDNFGWPTATTLDEVLAKMDRAGIDKAVITSTRSTRAKNMAECRAGNREMLEAVAGRPDRFIGACQVHPSSVEEAVAELRTMRERHAVRWLGELCGYLGGYSYDTDEFETILDAACDLGMTVQMHTADVETLRRQAGARPATSFVLSHLGGAKEHTVRVEAVAKHPNIYIDISGSDVSRAGILEAYLREAGPEKILFATDYIICEPIVYVARIEALNIGEEAKEKIFYRNIERLVADDDNV
ncbi:MAG: amidohydrolase [Planctomycetes bacterium]|nr:amidohydrolase [Planctomycetota bacterium]